MSRLDNLLEYYGHTRRVGHTTLMLDGVDYSRPGIILFASTAHARMAFTEAVRTDASKRFDHSDLRYKNIRFRPISILNDIQGLYRGKKPEECPPIIVDHFALQILVNEHTEELRKVYNKD